MWTEAAPEEQLTRLIDEVRPLFEEPHTVSRARTPVDLPAGISPARVVDAVVDCPAIWLDSGESGRQLIALTSAAEVAWSDGLLDVDARHGACQLRVAPFDGLDAVLGALRECAPQARLFGYLSYDLGTAIEELPEVPLADQPMPGFWFSVVDSWLEAVPGRSGAFEWKLHARDAERGNAALSELISRLDDSASAALGEGADQGGVIQSEPDEAGYRAAVERVVRRIHAGDFFEANICRRLAVPWTGSARLLYDRMRSASPGSHGAFLAAGDWAILSVSPETFLEVRGSVVATRPIKGTRRRGADTSADDALEADLLASDKDAAELSMIVDLARNDLGRVCRPGSVEVTEHRAVLRLPTVHHTYSTVRGELEPGTSVGRLLRAAFPPGSITGAPKIEAIRAAYAEEPRRRGVAMGSIGWIDPSGDVELSVAIRTATVAAGMATYHAGCGIVAESDPRAEYEETVAKAQPFLRAVKHE